MRKVDKDFSSPPEELLAAFQNQKENLIKRGKEHSFQGYEKAGKALKELYHDKCAYCESKMSSDFTVEHYRPKKGVYSYYWLGYEWSNLLPVCTNCNNPKGGKFPIAATDFTERDEAGKLERVKARKERPKLSPSGEWDKQAMYPNHSYLLEEQPYLLHPEIDEPWEYFRINQAGLIVDTTYTLIPKDVETRESKTVELVKLNREALIIARREVIADFEKSFKWQLLELVKLLQKGQIELNTTTLSLTFNSLFKKLESRIQATETYTLVARCCWEDLKAFFFPLVHRGNREFEKLLDVALENYLGDV